MKTVITFQLLLTKGSTPRPALFFPRRETRKHKKAVEGTLGSHRVTTPQSAQAYLFLATLFPDPGLQTQNPSLVQKTVRILK